MAISELERRMRSWAGWVIKITEGEAGWPNESIIAQFSKYGFIPKNSSIRSSYPIYSPSSEEVNKFINDLCREFPKYSDALYHYYTSKKKVKDLAKERNISERTFRDRVQRGKEWLHGKMDL